MQTQAVDASLEMNYASQKTRVLILMTNPSKPVFSHARRWPVPTPVEELLGGLESCSSYHVKVIKDDPLPGGGRFRVLEIAGDVVGGAPVAVLVRLALPNPDDPHVAVSLSGSGTSTDATLLWLAQRFKANHAVIDWVGRGLSPRHTVVGAGSDPLILKGDTFRDSYMFHNVRALWAALNWLFAEGLKPTQLIGSSWGGVIGLLLAGLDPRIEHVNSTYGCGGFFLPGIGRRAAWDEVIASMGAKRMAQWVAAFDPLLRLSDATARVYLESATNDKVFSLGMVGATWDRVRARNGFSLAPNRDQTMQPYPLQSYVLADMDRRGMRVPPRDNMAELAVNWEVAGRDVICWPIAKADLDQYRLIASEQAADVSDMSRAWEAQPAVHHSSTAAIFRLSPTTPTSAMVYFLQRVATVEGTTLRFTTRLNRSSAVERGLVLAAAKPTSLPHLLWQCPAGDLADSPIGDGLAPKLEGVNGAARATFTGVKGARTAVFGVKPWLLPKDWQAIELTFDEITDQAIAGLQVFLARNYQRADETTTAAPLSAAARRQEDGRTVIVCSRAALRPAKVQDVRRSGSDPTEAFDAIGLVDPEGQLRGALSLRSIACVGAAVN